MISVPRIRFAHLPTPIEELPRLSTFLGGPKLLIKRDDQTGLAFGGNKTRKLEFLIAEAQAQGARTLITTGALQSNHCRQTAAAAAKFGFDCKLVLSAPKDMQSFIPSNQSGNFLLDQLVGAQIILALPERRDEILNETFRQSWESGGRPYMVPYGGSTPIGAMGYLFAVDEMLSQGTHPDWVVFASSSGGTQAGLVLGSMIFDFKGRILGISIDEKSDQLQERIDHLIKETTSFLGEKIEMEKSRIEINDHFLGKGYGVMGALEREAISLFARLEGILLDPVYTGRAAAGLINLIRQKFFSSNETVLFWHTGGQPALFAKTYAEVITEK